MAESCMSVAPADKGLAGPPKASAIEQFGPKLALRPRPRTVERGQTGERPSTRVRMRGAGAEHERRGTERGEGSPWKLGPRPSQKGDAPRPGSGPCGWPATAQKATETVPSFAKPRDGWRESPPKKRPSADA